MQARRLLAPILNDDALTRGLADPEAKVLIEWLVTQAESLCESASVEKQTRDQIERLCRRYRAVARFVHLWCHEKHQGAAAQLAATERFKWPLPSPFEDACELMHTILDYESQKMSSDGGS